MGSGIGRRRLPFDAGTLTARLTDWPPTGHRRDGDALRPPPPDWPPKTDWPSGAGGHLHPHAYTSRPSDGEGPKAGLPYPLLLAPHWPSPALPHFPDFRERWQPDGEGGFSRAKGADTRVPVCPIPLRGPLPPPTGHLRAPAYPSLLATYAPSPTDWPKGGGDWPPMA